MIISSHFLLVGVTVIFLPPHKEQQLSLLRIFRTTYSELTRCYFSKTDHQVAEQTNGVITSNSHADPAASAEDVATSALTQMAHRATLELENLAATTMSSVTNSQGVITSNSNPIGV